MTHEMISPRLCTSFLCHCLLCGSVLLLPVLVVQHTEGAEMTPGRGIVILESSGNPAWKVLWDQAREYARLKKYSLAAASYAELVQLKPHIDEAQWEYCKVLVEQKDWLTASDLLERLLETDSDRSEYLQMAATVAFKNREFKRAVDYFGKVYGSDPAGPLAIEALKGLIAGLQGLGRKNMAFPLMEQLYLRTPHDPQLLQDLAGYAHELGDLKKAREYYTSLVTRSNTEARVLLQASKVFEEPGTEKEALTIWEKYLEKQPAYLPFHKKIADYYMQIGKSQSALPHILYMIDNGVEDDALLLVAGRIFLQKEGRPDKALHYFEEYAEKHPEDIGIQIDIKKIQKVLANDFLSIVENDGAWILWRDLVQVTPNRLAIYKEMAAQLEKRGKLKELLNVLLIIHHFHPDDEANIFRIAELYYEQKKYSDSLVFLKKITGLSTKDYSYLLMRARVEDKLGRELNALQLYDACLGIKPENHVVRLRTIKLAGHLGLVEQMQELFASAPENLDEVQEVELRLLYTEGLQENGMLKEAEDVYAKLLSESQNELERELEILFHKADTLRDAGHFFQAEQVLREILARNISVEKALTRLVQIGLAEKDLSRAKEWFALLLQKTGKLDWRGCSDPLSRNIFMQHISILMAEESFDVAAEDLQVTLQKLLTLDQTHDVQLTELDIQIALCRVFLKQEKYDQCLRLLTQLRNKRSKNLELALLWFQLSRKKGRSATAFNEIDQTLVLAGHLSLLRTIDSATLALEYGEFPVGLHHIEKALKVLPDSVTARILKAKLLTAHGELAKALQMYRSLIASVGEQSPFRQQILEIEFRLGNYGQVVKESTTASSLKANPSVDEKLQTRPVTGDYWRKLMLARALWVDKQWDAALKVYEMLLAEPVQKEFQTAMTQEKIEVFIPPLKKSIWNLLPFSSPETGDPLAIYMKPEFVGRHLGQPIDKITARIYEKYRWQKLIRNEYLAKKAVQQKDFHSAEKQYKKLIQEDSNVEGLSDLARIYGRLGEYGKEAELYQVIHKYGSVYPELNASIEQNELRRKPRLSADFDFVEKKGRDGNIDIKRKSQGSTVWFMPNLDKEASLEYRRNTYSASGDAKTLLGHKFVGLYSQNVNQDMDILFRLGGEKNDQYDTTPLAGIEVSRRLDENLKGYVAFNQDTVYDTLEAIETGIYSQDFEAGLVAAPQGGYVFGGDYRRRLYSDDNSQNQFHLWSAYTLYNDSNTYKFQYNYKLTRNNDENLPTTVEVLPMGFLEDIPYWSPGEYWEHLATISYQRLLTTFSLLKETPSYYTIDYSAGYESGQNIVYKAGFEIFLEITPHFLLKGIVTYSTSEEYDQKGALISLIYRW